MHGVLSCFHSAGGAAAGGVAAGGAAAGGAAIGGAAIGRAALGVAATRAVVIGLGVVVAAAGGGCSLLAVRPPVPIATGQARVNVSCSDEKYAPALDMASVAGAMGALVTADAAEVKLGEVLLAGVFLGSAIYGYYQTGKCSEAKEDAFQFHAEQLLHQTRLLQVTAGSAPPARSSPPPRHEKVEDD